MFELRCVVKDKSLGDALRALKPIALEPPVVIPVDNDQPDPVANVGHCYGHRSAVKAKKGPKFKRTKNSKPTDQIVAEYIMGNSNPTITRQEMVHEIVKYGYVPGSQSYAFNRLRESGLITETSVQGVYDIHREKAEQHG